MLKSKQKILFVVDELPFPPRNGVTIPIYHFIIGLRKYYEIALLLIVKENDNIDDEILNNNRSIVDHFFVLKIRNACFLSALCREFFLISPSFSGLGGEFFKNDGFKITKFDPDIIFCSPIRAIANLKFIKNILIDRDRRVVAAISDAYTATLRMHSKQIFGYCWPMTHRVKSVASWLRSFWMMFLERKILNEADVILVQTSMDREWICKISNSRFKDRTYILSNGVNKKLLETIKVEYRRSFGYIGSLKNPCHKININFLIKNILPKIQNKYYDAKFFVLGKSDCSGLSSLLKVNSGVVYKEYVHDMVEFYTSVPILFVRNFKNIGLINRTIESMAAGVVVIGEKGAFNGIEGFQDGVHGFIAQDEDQILKYLFLLFDNPKKWYEVSSNAKKLIKNDFQWEDRLGCLNDLLMLKEKGASGSSGPPLDRQ